MMGLLEALILVFLAWLVITVVMAIIGMLWKVVKLLSSPFVSLFVDPFTGTDAITAVVLVAVLLYIFRRQLVRTSSGWLAPG